MRTFEHFPPQSKCPLCGTSEDKECALIPIDGTQDDNLCEGMPVHTACIADYDKYRYNGSAGNGVIYRQCLRIT